MTRHVAVTASLEPTDRVSVDGSFYDDRFTVRFGAPLGVDVLVTGPQLEALRIACGLALLERSEA